MTSHSAGGSEATATSAMLTNCVTSMALPLKPPVKPQLALSRKALPEGEEWVYEPKYDGFRALAFVDGDDVYLQSRNGKPLRRYFPELRVPGRRLRDRRRARDPGRRRRRGLRRAPEPHPPGRVADQHARGGDAGASSVAFDLLAAARTRQLGEPFEARREALEKLVGESDDPARSR